MATAKRPFLRRGPSGPLADPNTGIIQVGYDQPIELMRVPAPGGLVGLFPRDLAGNPLRVVLPGVTPGNYLEVDWRLNIGSDDSAPYTGPSVFIAAAIVSFDGSDPFVASGFVIVNSGGSESMNPNETVSIGALAAVLIPVGAVSATVELIYIADGDIIVDGDEDPKGEPSLSATLKATEIGFNTVSQPGPGNLQAFTPP